MVKAKGQRPTTANGQRQRNREEEADAKEGLESATNPYGLNGTMELFFPCRWKRGVSRCRLGGEGEIRDKANP